MAVDEALRARTQRRLRRKTASGRDRGPISSVMKNAITACDLARRSAERGKSGGKSLKSYFLPVSSGLSTSVAN